MYSLSSNIREATEFLLLNAYTIERTGLVDGKAGIALALFETARFYGESAWEEHAFNLIEEALAHDVPNNDLAGGKAGLSYALHYLIDNQLLDADYWELYGLQHNSVIEAIKQMPYGEQQKFTYLDYWLWLHALEGLIYPPDFNECKEKLSGYIMKILTLFESNPGYANSAEFYYYASRLISLCNAINITKTDSDSFVYAIRRIHKNFKRKDIICDNPLFGQTVYLYGLLNDKKDISQTGLLLTQDEFRNMVPCCLSFRQISDIIPNLYRIFAKGGSDLTGNAYSIFETLYDEDAALFEKKIYNHLFKQNSIDFGLGYGLSRLLLLNVFVDCFKEHKLPDRLFKLMI